MLLALAVTRSSSTSTATVAPTDALAGAADREPAMTRVVAPLSALMVMLPSWVASRVSLTVTPVPVPASILFCATATAKEPAMEALLSLCKPPPNATEPAMAST